MTTAITATTLGQAAGPISLTTSDEAVNITFAAGSGIKAFMMIADALWKYDSRSGQTDSPRFQADQSLAIQSPSATDYTFYARTASGTGKLYIIFLG